MRRQGKIGYLQIHFGLKKETKAEPLETKRGHLQEWLYWHGNPPIGFPVELLPCGLS
jgi:hypothetical protein